MIRGFDSRALFDALAPRRREPPAAPPARDATTPLRDRERHDTVTLSDGAGKIVNLNRGNELAAELRHESDPVAFRDKLRLALADVRRIGRLFGEVATALFRRGRPPLF